MTGNDRDDQVLDALFAEARERPAAPSPDFMARLAAEAEANLPRAAPRAVQKPGRMTWLKGLFTASGLSGAALAGVWFGFAMPEALDTLDFSADTTVALSTFLPSADLGAVFDE